MDVNLMHEKQIEAQIAEKQKEVDKKDSPAG
jgi:hypothetical protein